MKKSSILIIPLVILTFTIATIGTAYSYFTISTDQIEETGSVEIGAKKPANAVLKYTSINMPSKNIIHPGTKNYIGARIIATAEGDGAEYKSFITDYTVEAKLTVEKEGESSSYDFPLTYEMYETTTEIEEPLTCDTVVETPDGINMKYTQKCEINSEVFSSDNLIASGQIEGGTSEYEITSDELSIITGETKYYYLIIEYPNRDENQTSDQGKEINLNITGVTTILTKDNTEYKY